MNNCRTRIKFCGITRVEDARSAVDAGADAIGLVFHPESPRYVTPEDARNIAAAVPALVSVVGLFVNPAPEQVEAVLQEVRIDLLQFHGDEDQAFCAAFGRPWMKALRVRPGMDVAGRIGAYPQAAAILLDAWHPQVAGGTGAGFDWNLIENSLPRERLVLAGGLDADNVAGAIARVRPFAVDVSSGIETAPGRKSAAAMQAFYKAVNSGSEFSGGQYPPCR